MYDLEFKEKVYIRHAGYKNCTTASSYKIEEGVIYFRVDGKMHVTPLNNLMYVSEV